MHFIRRFLFLAAFLLCPELLIAQQAAPLASHAQGKGRTIEPRPEVQMLGYLEIADVAALLPDEPEARNAQLEGTGQNAAAQNPAVQPSQPGPGAEPAPAEDSTATPAYGQQPKRILGMIPNYRAVGANVKPPPPTIEEKFKVATLNSFDYSAFIFNAVNVEIPYIEKSYPEFGNGMAAYGRYFWRGFVDKGIGNYMTDFVVPTLTRQDPRYYTMGTGKWYRRVFYAYTRLLVTPNDAGHMTFNYSEVVGKGAAAGLGNLYYPGDLSWTKTGQRWLVQVAVRDGGFDIFREFWPDIAVHVLRQKPSQQK